MFILFLTNCQIRHANANEIKEKPSVQNLKFGHDFTDHMLRIKWNDEEGWKQPQITPLTYMRMHPAAKVLHYAQELYEGMKVDIYVFNNSFQHFKILAKEIYCYDYC